MENKPLTEFQEFPKIPRLGAVVMRVTEKIDGTNGCVVIAPIGPYSEEEVTKLQSVMLWNNNCYAVMAQSRNRFLKPEGEGPKGCDNYAFAAWVRANAEELVKLGPGRHYGEWYGCGIGRNYGLFAREFALFNERTPDKMPACCKVVPTLFFGPFNNDHVFEVERQLRASGSVLVPGFAKPEGVVVELLGGKTRMKITDAVQGKKHGVAA